ncbi:hypothetical protein ACOMHN_037393 [Nucella lapillus]
MDAPSPAMPNYTNIVYEEPDEDRRAEVDCTITFIILTCVLNALVVACIIRLYLKTPEVRVGLPKLLVMLVCCVVMIVDALVLSSVSVHFRMMSTPELFAAFSCETAVAVELSSFMLVSVETMLIAGVLLLEGLRRQRFSTFSSKVQMLVAVALLVLAVMYAVVVVVPVFFLVWLRNSSQPCREGAIFLDLNPDEKSGQMIHIVHYVIPHSFVFYSFLLLLVSYFSSKRSTTSSSYVQYPPTPLTDKTSNPNTDASLSACGGRASANTAPCAVISPKDDGFPWFALLAAVVSFACGLVFFFCQYAAHDLFLSREVSRRLWVAGVMLSLLRGVLLPCCWMLDRHLRAVWTSCCPGGRPSPDTITQGEGDRMMDTAQL